MPLQPTTEICLMNSKPAILCASLILLALFILPGRASAFDYPETRKTDVTDNYHGTIVADPYRWLEDLDSEETARWVDAQNEITYGYFEKSKFREKIRASLTERWNYTRFGAPLRSGGLYIYKKNDGLQNQYITYVQDSPDGDPRVLIDPNQFSEDGTVALSYHSISKDGRYIAYGKSSSGSDWETIYVKDIRTGEILPDKLEWIKFIPAAWTGGNNGFYYCRYDKPAEGATYEQMNQFPKIYYHKLRDPQSADILIHERPDNGDLGFEPFVSDDGRFLVIGVWQGSSEKYRIHYIDLADDPYNVVRLLDDFDAAYTFLGNTGTEFYFLTDLNAPNKRIVSIDISKPDRENWRELVAESDAVIKKVVLANDHFVISSLKDVQGQISVHDLEGKFVREIPLPGIGSVENLSGERGGTDVMFLFYSFTYPATLFRYDFTSDEMNVFRASEIDIDQSRYETKQVFYKSKDGTRVPMFLVHQKGLTLDGRNRTYLYGYGGFNVIEDPSFSVSTLEWIDRGGVFALPGLRGGGEYGSTWHEAGMLDKKQNVFDDFIAAAEYLIDQGYTSTPYLSIGGGSNGGLLTGACVLQRPDLFGAVFAAVGVMDMLRFHKFTIGWAWTSDYGCADEPDQFPYLYDYSPVHNVKMGTEYPPVLITTSDHDDRVVPSHSFKFAAAMQEAQAGDAPILIRITKKAGHSAGKPTSIRIAEATDRLTFLMETLGEE